MVRNKRGIRSAVFLAGIISMSFFLASCSVSYPKERLKESIIKICKKEYNIDVKVETVGDTIAIYLPLEDLMDFTFSLTSQASEKINDVILSVARVALSTDANYQFYCVIAHDVRIPEIQIVIIKSVDDVKRLMLHDISRGEYAKRILIDLRLNPQSQKERSVRDVFQRMDLDEKWQEEVMDDFFRSEPAALGDIGYWNGRFYIKDISLPEFMAEQMASRIKVEFKENNELAAAFNFKSVKGTYISRPENRCFKIEILADPRSFEDISEVKTTDDIFRALAFIASEVAHGYRFEDFDFVEIVNQNDGSSIRILKDDLELLRKKKIKFEDITGQSRIVL